MSQIKAVSFDVGGTLIEPWPSVGEVYASVAREHGFPGPDAAVLQREFFAAWGRRSQFDYTRDAWAGLVAEVFDNSGQAGIGGRVFPAIYDRFKEARSWRVFDDVLPAIGLLRRRGIRLLVISNWDDRLEATLSAVGLLAHFEFVIGSFAVGAPKPDPKIYLHAAEKAGILPCAILHVGDSEREDVRGAQMAGFASVGIHRKPGTPGPGWIGDLKELENRLD